MPERGVVYGVARDVTDRRKADAELREAQRMLEASRDELRLLADEQAALRRVATLVAREPPPDRSSPRWRGRSARSWPWTPPTSGATTPDGTIVSVAQWGGYPTSRSARDCPSRATTCPPGCSAQDVRHGSTATSTSPAPSRPPCGDRHPRRHRRADLRRRPDVGRDDRDVEVGGRAPGGAESRLQEFTDLLATAISNASAHDKARVLAEEQAALRRVATLVAQQNPQAEVFKAIAEEIGGLLGVDSIAMVRYAEERFRCHRRERRPDRRRDPDRDAAPLDGRNVTSRVRSTGRAARADARGGRPTVRRGAARGRIRSVVGTPIMVEGRLWGAMLAGTHDAPLPPDTESRIEQFTELMATAIANAEARGEVARLADEQAALRRVATLVAQGAPPDAVFDAVTGEVAQLLDASAVTLARYEDDTVTVVAQHGRDYVGVGDRFPLGGRNVASIVRRTGRTARLDDVAQATGAIGDRVRRATVRSAVAAPIVVNGRIWGVLAAIWKDRGPPPDDTEERLDRFAELLDTAIANADSRDELTASRARVLAAERRGPQARGARPARRRPAAARAHDRDAQARAAGAPRRRRHADALLAEALDTPSRATPSCASWRTGSCRRCSTTAGCTPASTRSRRDSTCRSSST